MLTPAFELHQEHSYLLLTIKAPYIKVSATKILHIYLYMKWSFLPMKDNAFFI